MSYKTIELKRGFYEIKDFFKICQESNAVICGGYARYCASPLPMQRLVLAGDVDIFPRTEGASEKVFKALTSMGFEKRHENKVSITLQPKEDKKDQLDYLPIPQIIKPVTEGSVVTLGSVEEILDNFDFTIARAAIISSTEVLVDEQFEADERKKILRLKNIHCPISSLLRCCKYTRKGYFMRPAEAIKLFNDWTDRGDDYRIRILELFKESAKGEKSKENPGGMTREEIDELESLLRID